MRPVLPRPVLPMDVPVETLEPSAQGTTTVGTDVDGGKPDDEDNFCGGFNNKNKCYKKSDGACVWKDGCVPNGGLLGGFYDILRANEDMVGAEAIGQQSNSGNDMTDMPLASAAMMLLSLYYAFKW